MPDPRQLPVRTEPLPGEFWPGYVRRVADRFGATWADVMSPVLPEQDLGKARWHAGVCVSDASAECLASYFRVDAVEVQAMHLESVFGGSALVLDDRVRAQFDPWPTVSPAGDHLRLTACGPVRNRVRRVSCSACRAQTPGLVRLAWQIVWLPVCEEHNLVLTGDGEQGVPADLETRQAQTVLRARLTSGEENARFFEHLTVLTRSLLGMPHRGSLSPRAPAALASVLPAAVRGIDAEGFPVSQGLVEPAPERGLRRGRVFRHPAQRLHAPTPPPRKRARSHAAPLVATFPWRLPVSLFAGPVSDLLYEVAASSTHRGSGPEEVAAITAAMVRTGLDAEAAVAALFDPGPRIVRRRANEVLFALAEIEEHGRLEDYWAAIRSAARVLERQGVDYRDRRALWKDRAFTSKVLRAELASPVVVWSWLAREWACDDVPTHAPEDAFWASLDRSTLTAVTPRLNRNLHAVTAVVSTLAS